MCPRRCRCDLPADNNGGNARGSTGARTQKAGTIWVWDSVSRKERERRTGGGIVKWRMDDPTVPIWAKVRAIEKVAGFPTLNGITKDELQKCLQWLFHYFDFDI